MRLLWPLLLIACAKPKPVVEEPKPESSELQWDMRHHFELATQARDGVIRGKLDVARTAGQQLAQHYDGRLPEAWQPQLAEMRRAATATMEAPNLDAAGVAVAELAQACGSCHGALGTGPRFPTEDLPPEGTELRDKMARHQWAADRMWEGLIAPDDALYAAGARALTQAPVWGTEALPDEVAQIEAGVRTSAEHASEAPSTDVRVVAYGQLLATCARCHAVARP